MRYSNRIRVLNDSERDRQSLNDRGVRQIYQYPTPKLAHPTPTQIATLNSVEHIWTTGDRFFKLANEYYSSSQMWWVIAWFNQKPTEAHMSAGDSIQIPLPLERVLSFLEV